MTWDVFVSHASEDKPFARELVAALEEAGLWVWFDEQALFAGDSLRRAINKGLSESQYGLVILSPNFFAKEWPQKELDGLVAREDGKEKVIIPIWHQVSAQEVRKYSPMLADKLSISSEGAIADVVDKTLRAIYQDRQSSDGWSAPTIILPDTTELLLLPIAPRKDLVFGIARHPVTNAQYKTFMAATTHAAPTGKNFIDGDWKGPFAPLDDPNFRHPQQPVVCVDFIDAFSYCQWVNKMLENESRENYRVFLPLVELWDLTAFGWQYENKNRKGMIFSEQGTVHDNSNSPALIDESGARTNHRGVSDIFGNVWEWCIREIYDTPFISITNYRTKDFNLELRGGSFLDDLGKFKDTPAVPVRRIKDGRRTRHADLGFRIAAILPAKNLKQTEHVKLSLQPRLPSHVWDACEEVAFSSYEIGVYDDF